MPIKKHGNKKNAPRSKRDDAIVPPKEKAMGHPLVVQRTAVSTIRRVTGVTTAGKKKKPR